RLRACSKSGKATARTSAASSRASCSSQPSPPPASSRAGPCSSSSRCAGCSSPKLPRWPRSASTRTIRARLWHGIADRGALDLAREEHTRIYDAIAARDPDLARAATLLHIVTNETWLRRHLGPADDVPLDA